MTVASHQLAAALAHYSAGRLEEARQICERIATVDPSCVEAWQILGVVAYQRSEYDTAIWQLERALSLSPNNAEIYYNLANAFKNAERLNEAVARYEQALRLRPEYAEAHNNLGNVLHEQGRTLDGILCYRRAIALNPGHAGAHFNLGNALRQINQLEEAASCYLQSLSLNSRDAEVHNILGCVLTDLGRHAEAAVSHQRALELDATRADFHNSLGVAFQRQGKNDAAIVCHRRAIELNPDDADAHNNLGNALENRGDTGEAVASYRKAVELKPDFAVAISNLGIALRELGEVAEAIVCLQRAAELRPNSAEILSNLATALWDGGRIGEAVDCFRRGQQLNPELAPIRINQAYLTLLTGDFENGWREYEWRWKAGDIAERAFREPKWEGQPLDGKVILLHAEQGLGDTIQFVRYAPLVKQRGGRVIVECQKSLLPLLATAGGIDCLVAAGDQLPSFDYQIPLLSLPAIFRTSLDTIPVAAPYLVAGGQLCDRWRERLSNVRGLRIGINWHGRAGRRESVRRDVPWRCFGPLADLPGVSLINLQQNFSSDELKLVRERLRVIHPGDDVDQTEGAFMDTAAIMTNVDLVITSDTSVAHVAGALGVPVWVVLPFVPNWRWLLDRSDSPWYPTMRLFRQSSPGDWEGVMAEVRDAVANWLS